ncbi:MAG: CHAD domain-containing protein [Bacteroidota bacterium]
MKGKGRRERGTLTIREEAQRVIPDLLEDFLSRAERVVGFPSRMVELHEMRLAGKPLRYMMEFCTPNFGPEFASALEEVKRLVTLLGRTHDCDVHIPRARTELAVIRRFNRTTSQRRDRIPTMSLVQYIRRERTLRATMYHEACGILQRWKSEALAAQIRRSLVYPPFT